MALVLLLASFNPPQRAYNDRVDVIEVNHYFDDQARLVFDQVIFWRWNRWDSRYDVVAWRMMKNVREKPEKGERPRWVGGHATPRRSREGWCSHWFDRKDRVYRRVLAGDVRETWTSYDPELLDREWLSLELREGLLPARDAKIQSNRFPP